MRNKHLSKESKEYFSQCCLCEPSDVRRTLIFGLPVVPWVKSNEHCFQHFSKQSDRTCKTGSLGGFFSAARVLRMLTLFQTMNVIFYTLCQTRPRKSVSQVVAHCKSHGKLFTVMSIMRSQSLSRSSNYRTLIGRILVSYERWQLIAILPSVYLCRYKPHKTPI